MDEADRQLLRRCRLQLVCELQMAELWDALLSRGLFTPDMIEEIQGAGSGSRRDQARQLITDLETRGRQALPLFISCLQDTGQDMLASFLNTSRQTAEQNLEAIRPRDLVPGPVGFNPDEMRVVKQDPSRSTMGRLPTVVLRPDKLRPTELRPEVLRPQVPRPVTTGSGELRDACAPRWGGKANLAYILEADPCGYCLIINNVNFCLNSGLSSRTGSDIDCEKLQRRFRLLHFMVEVKCDLTAKKDHGFEVASASSEDWASGSNPESDAAPFQEGPGSSDQPDAVASLPTPSDIFVSYSTFPGFVSWRDTRSGSWYIEILDGVLEQWADSEDLQTLLLRVADAVSEKGIYKQMPGYFNFLRKKLFFKT
ncbi:caspase-9 isoform 2-T2 [Trichechus inunguis]